MKKSEKLACFLEAGVYAVTFTDTKKGINFFLRRSSPIRIQVRVTALPVLLGFLVRHDHGSEVIQYNKILVEQLIKR